jgi:serine protease AprX
MNTQNEMNASNDLLIQNYDEVSEWNECQKALSLQRETQDEDEKLKVIKMMNEAFGLYHESDLEGAVEEEDITAAFEFAVIKKRNEAFSLYQRLRLSTPVDETEVTAALLWMTEQGKELEDLITVKNFRITSEFDSHNIQQLCYLSEKSILQHLTQQNYYFKVICSSDDLNEFEKEIYSLETYSSFSIILASDEVIERIRMQYPIGKLQYPKLIPRHSKNDQLKQFLEHVADTTMIDIIQLNRSIDIQLKQQVETAGAEVLRVLSGSGLILSTPNAETRNKIVSMNEVSKVEQYVPSISLEERFIEYLQNKGELAEMMQQSHEQISLLGLLIAIFFKQEYRDQAAKNLAKLGIKVVEEAGENMLVIDLINHTDERKAFWTVFNQPGLRLIEEDTMPEISSNVAVNKVVYGANHDPDNFSELPWTGTGEIISIADTGIDTGIKETLHDDLRTQVLHIKSYPFNDEAEAWDKWKDRVNNIDENISAADLRSGHGTHVSGIAIGNGTRSNQQIKGIAPNAQLIFQGLERTLSWSEKEIRRREILGLPLREDNLFGLPTDLLSLFSFAYQHGARIHSNSWGSKPGQYENRSEQTDKFMWENKDFLVVVAAGNHGQHKEKNNQWIDVDNMINSPGTSKNCLTVGACENYRFPDLSKTYSDMNENKFPHAPFNQDQIADSFDDIAAFSSRGCFNNGRYKPDVVAPGTLILSTRSSQISMEETGSLPYETDNQNYMYMCGTSMATPLVAGGAALVRQYLRQQKRIENPSAALIKATIIHSAEYIEYRFKNLNSYPWVDHEQGWGRVTLSNSLIPKSSIKVVFEDRKEGLIQGKEYEYQILVENDSEPLKIIMAYMDYPWDETRGNESKLVNNLNLIAYTPSSSYYIGNHFDEERELDKKWLDTINNVEGIMVTSPELGVWKIKVVASEIKFGEKQDFALVASYGVKKTQQ